MAFRAFATKPQSAPVFAEVGGGGGIDSLGQVNLLVRGFSSQGGQYTLGSKGSFMQANTNRVINGVGNRGNGCCEGTFAAFLGAEWAFGIDTLHDNRLNLRRFD